MAWNLHVTTFPPQGPLKRNTDALGGSLGKSLIHRDTNQESDLHVPQEASVRDGIASDLF